MYGHFDIFKRIHIDIIKTDTGVIFFKQSFFLNQAHLKNYSQNEMNSSEGWLYQ